MFFPYQEGDSSSAYLVVMNSFDVAISMEVKVDIKPRFQSGIIFAVAGTTGKSKKDVRWLTIWMSMILFIFFSRRLL